MKQSMQSDLTSPDWAMLALALLLVAGWLGWVGAAAYALVTG
jgi:hypothetical protein